MAQRSQVPKAFIRNLTGKNRDKKADAQLGVLLAFVAGAINAGGFLAAGQYTSHMTGLVSGIADHIVLHGFQAALLAFLYVFCFMGGAAVSAIVINAARRKRFQSEFSLALMLEACLLLVFGFVASSLTASAALSVHLTIALLCFIMGLQNAIITKISRAEIRTTHVTGLVTDIGIEVGRFCFSRCVKSSEVTFHPGKLKLHAALLASFFGGGLAGAALFKTVGFVATLPFALVLGIIACVPILDDLQARVGRG